MRRSLQHQAVCHLVTAQIPSLAHNAFSENWQMLRPQQKTVWRGATEEFKVWNNANARFELAASVAIMNETGGRDRLQET